MRSLFDIAELSVSEIDKLLARATNPQFERSEIHIKTSYIKNI